MKIGILCTLDGFANSVRPLKIKEFLEKRGYHVKIIDTYFISRMHRKRDNKRSIFNSLPGLSLNKLRLYFLELKEFLASNKISDNSISSKKIIKRMKIRGEILYNLLKKESFDVVICENATDSYVLTKKLDCLKIYDCPTPSSDEIFFSGKISKQDQKELRDFEKIIYSKSNLVSFHWQTYKDYVQDEYSYKKDNLFILNWGTEPREKSVRAKYNKNPKVIFLGNLGYWANLQLLSKLSKLYPIDVYGSPEPDKKLELNYKGYTTPKILSKYQFGLITLTKDKLRKYGFSAKNLEYISYGLPVLMPEWRRNMHLIKGHISYNEKNFLKKIKEYSNKDKWNKISNEAYQQAKEYTWEKNLVPLFKIIESYRIKRNSKQK